MEAGVNEPARGVKRGRAVGHTEVVVVDEHDRVDVDQRDAFDLLGRAGDGVDVEDELAVPEVLRQWATLVTDAGRYWYHGEACTEPWYGGFGFDVHAVRHFDRLVSAATTARTEVSTPRTARAARPTSTTGPPPTPTWSTPAAPARGTATAPTSLTDSLMSHQHNTFHNPGPATAAMVRAAIDQADISAACDAIVGSALHGDGDWKELQDLYLSLLDGQDPQVASVAMICLGHLARVYRHFR